MRKEENSGTGYSTNGYPVCPADEVMRKNEGNLTREEYADMMGFKKPDEDSGWIGVARVLVVTIVVFVVVMLFASCASRADADPPPDNEALTKALHFLCALTPQGRAMAVIDLNKSLDESNVSFGIGCPADMFQINIQHGDISGQPATRLNMEVFYMKEEGEGTI